MKLYKLIRKGALTQLKNGPSITIVPPTHLTYASRVLRSLNIRHKQGYL